MLSKLEKWKRCSYVSDPSLVSFEMGMEGFQRVCDEVENEYAQACSIYANGVVNCVHMIFGALPPSHTDMDLVGRVLVHHMLDQITTQCMLAPALSSKVVVEIEAMLCPVDAGNVQDLCDEWIRLLGEVLCERAGAGRASGATGAA